MASTFSTNLALELIGTGDQAGSWGNTTNTNLGTLIEQAISGYVTQGVTTGNTTSITIPDGASGVARNMFIELTGTGGTNTVLAVPANKKLYFIYNNTSGAVTVKVGAGTGVSVAATEKKILVSNGTDIVEATSYLTAVGGSLTLTTLTATSATITNLTSTSLTLSNNPTLSAGTANGVLYLNGSKVATSGSALTFDGTGKFGVGTTTPVGGVSAGFEAVGEIWASTASSNANQIRLSPATSGANIIYSTYAGSGSYLPLAFNVSGSEQMRLTSTGLGIGTASPSQKLSVNSGASTTVAGFTSTGSSAYLGLSNSSASIFLGNDSTSGSFIVQTPSGSFSTKLTLDNSGNLGLGVTPSADWASSSYKAFVVRTSFLAGSTAPGAMVLGNNAYNDGAGWKYVATGVASYYVQNAGVHSWSYAPSGTAGNAITFTQAMTLDASGRLLLGTTSASSVSAASGSYLQVVGNSSGNAGLLSLSRSVTAVDTAVLGQIVFADNVGQFAEIRAQCTGTPGTNDYPGSLMFYTTPDNSATCTERARITATGNLLVGTTTDVASRSGTISDISGNVRAIPRVGSAKTAVYTLSISDVGQYVELGTGGAIDVPNAIFSTGDVVSVFNNTTGARTISLTITTAYLAGTDADKASVSLATRGVATILFISNSVCVVSGNVS